MIPGKAFRTRLKVKGSTFIGTISPAVDKASAEKFIWQIRKEFHDATHNCFAYRLEANRFRYSDDGEPSGTAGKPILSVIDKHQLEKTVLLVSRYFGGIKLGTGGLIRAYSECAERTVSQAKIIKKFNYIILSIQYPFSLENKIQKLIHQYDARIRQMAAESGMEGEVKVMPSQVEAFKAELLAAGQGQVQIKDS